MPQPCDYLCGPLWPLQPLPIPSAQNRPRGDACEELFCLPGGTSPPTIWATDHDQNTGQWGSAMEKSSPTPQRQPLQLGTSTLQHETQGTSHPPARWVQIYRRAGYLQKIVLWWVSCVNILVHLYSLISRATAFSPPISKLVSLWWKESKFNCSKSVAISHLACLSASQQTWPEFQLRDPRTQVQRGSAAPQQISSISHANT